MKRKLNHIEHMRVHLPGYPDGTGTRNGSFVIPFNGLELFAICSDGSDWHKSGLTGKPWEHVSVSLTHRCPTWEEMEHVRSLFFDDDETVVQFSVPRSEHLNHHEFCLHMWRMVAGTFPKPPAITVAPVA